MFFPTVTLSDRCYTFPPTLPCLAASLPCVLLTFSSCCENKCQASYTPSVSCESVPLPHHFPLPIFTQKLKKKKIQVLETYLLFQTLFYYYSLESGFLLDSLSPVGDPFQCTNWIPQGLLVLSLANICPILVHTFSQGSPILSMTNIYPKYNCKHSLKTFSLSYLFHSWMCKSWEPTW